MVSKRHSKQTLMERFNDALWVISEEGMKCPVEGDSNTASKSSLRLLA